LTYELDFVVDEVLRDNAFKPFQEAGENVDKAMTSFKSDYDSLNA
jgi:hypothetical protein